MIKKQTNKKKTSIKNVTQKIYPSEMNWRYFPKQTNVVGVHQTRLILKEMLNKDLHAKIKKC